MENISMPYITKYEFARVLGTRALQISMNAPIMIDIGQETDPLKIAIMEFEQNRLPFKIIRRLPNGKTEAFKLSDLKNVHQIDF